MKQVRFMAVIIAIGALLSSCNNESTAKKEVMESKIITENVSYKTDSLNMDGYIAYDSNQQGKRPGILIIHEWWGLNDYAKRRARELAQLGYVAMAIDMYGNGQRGNDVASASALAMPFYKDPQMAKARFDAALAEFKKNAQVDTTNLAAIGYCFGGAMVLNMARMGEDLKGVVSFHGNLLGVPLDKKLLKANVLVCHGNADPFVPAEEVAKFRHQMDSVGAAYTFKGYDSALHAFTNPDATENGKKFNIPIAYNAAADTASWNDMKTFFGTIFKH